VFYKIFALVCWPVVVISTLSFAYAGSWRHPMPLAVRRSVLGLSFVMMLTPTSVFFWLANDSVSMLVGQDLFYIAFGSFLIVGIFIWADIKSRNKIAAFALGLVGIAMGSWYLVGDYVLSRKYAAGIVTRLERPFVQHAFVVYIGGGRYHVTNDLLPVMSVGARVRIEYGVASHSIFNAATLPAAAR
jgi:hypothetical protein